MTLQLRSLEFWERESIERAEALFHAEEYRREGEIATWRLPWLYEYRSEEMARRVALRARIIHRAAVGVSPPAIARELGLGIKMVRHWIKEFNARGLAGLADADRAGRPIVHGRYSHRAGRVIEEVAFIPPPQLGLPFAHWSPARLSRYLTTERGVPIAADELARMFRFQDDAGE